MHEALRRLGFSPDDIHPRPDLIDGATGAAVVGLVLSTQGKYFTLTDGPYPKEPFARDWEAARVAWNAAPNEDAFAVYEASGIAWRAVELVAAITNKGIVWPRKLH